MKLTATLLLLLAALLLGAAIRFLARHTETAAERYARTTTVLRVSGDTTTAIAIERGDFRAECVRKDGAWFLQQPVQAKADDGAVDRILNSLARLPKREVITAEERRRRELTLADYGLQPPRARLILRDSLGRKELLVGTDALNAVHVKLDSSEDVVATSRAVWDELPATVEALRDRAVLHGDPARVTRLEMRRGANLVQLVRNGGDWTFAPPATARADRARVSGVLQRLYALRVDRFVWDPPARPPAEPGPAAGRPAASAEARAETFGLVPDLAVARVHVWCGGDPLGEELILGKPADEKGETIYAKLRDKEAVCAVSKAVLDAVSATAGDLRDRAVFAMPAGAVRSLCFQQGDARVAIEWRAGGSGWTMTEPVEWRADRETVEAMLRRLLTLSATRFSEGRGTNLAEYGLAPPAWSAQVVAERAATGEEPRRGPETNRLLVGAARADERTVWANLAGDGAVFELAADAAARAKPDVSDPLALRDRTILAIAPESVKKIALARDAGDQSVGRTESGAWVAIEPPTGDVLTQAVDDVLLLAANLRAVSIECDNPRTPAIYGLDRPWAALTLGLSGGGGIQKTLMLGGPAKNDGIYAMVQGQDVVFVLAAEAAERLRRDLVQTTPPLGRTGAEAQDIPAAEF